MDYYALSFVRDAEVIHELKAWLAEQGESWMSRVWDGCVGRGATIPVAGGALALLCLHGTNQPPTLCRRQLNYLARCQHWSAGQD